MMLSKNSGTNKLQQKEIVVAIRSSQSFNIALPTVSYFCQAFLPPGKTWLPENLDEKQIGHEPGLPTISIGKEVNRNQTMMKAGGNLIRWIAKILHCEYFSLIDFILSQRYLDQSSNKTPRASRLHLLSTTKGHSRYLPSEKETHSEIVPLIS